MSKPFESPGRAPLPLRIDTVVDPGRPLLCSASGDLDAASADDLERDLLDAAHRHRESRMILDLSQIGFIDSTGLRALWRVAGSCRSAGGGLALHSPSRSVRRLLALAGLDRAVAVGGDVDRAREMLERGKDLP